MKNIRIIAMGGVMLLSGVCDVQAQGFFGKLKNVGEKIVNQAKTKNSGTKSSGQSARSKRLEKQVDAMVGARNNRNVEDEAPTVRLPEQHTALLDPLGYDVDASHGRLSQKQPQVPPAKAADQVNWVTRQPSCLELDNASLVAEYEALKKAEASGKIDFRQSPAKSYFNNIWSEVLDRINALIKLVEVIEEAKSEYKLKLGDETYNWVIHSIHNELVKVLDGGGYKRAVRSSLEPLFTEPGCFGEKWRFDNTKKYFEEHGGLKTAHSVKWTHWDPTPNKAQAKTSSEGQTATVVNSGKTGATVDIDGVRYVIHVNQGRAIVRTSFKTAVQGKDIVIPDKLEHNGVMYPVKEIVGCAFENAEIRSVKLPSTLVTIGHKAFRGCNMTELVIPASVKVVEGSAFLQCRNLTKVVFQAQSMKQIDGCFAMCPKLQSVTFPASLQKDMTFNMFKGCTSLSNVVLPKNLRTIPKGMFEGCKSLKTLNVPSTVTKVEAGAFSGSGVMSLYLPNLQEAAPEAFYGCMSMKSLTVGKAMMEKFKANNYELYVDCFGNNNPTFNIRVTNGKLSIPSSVKVAQ